MAFTHSPATDSTDSTGSADAPSTRSVRKVLPSIETLEGAGFIVHRPFPVGDLDQIDPFLLIDHMGPVDYAPGEAVGAPDHPHRGFETVSYILEGELEHEDSVGHHGVIGPGDVQWMTAGSGVVHSEMPSRRVQTEGGRVEGFQIWVNLPAAEKMTAPRYQEVPRARIPRVELDEGRAVVRLIAGRAHGIEGAVETTSPILYAHVTVQPGGQVDLPAAAEMNAMVYVIHGSGTVASADRPVRQYELAVLEHDGDSVLLAAGDDEPFDVLVLAGVPLREPIARYGPFVMNTRQQIVEAFDDYQAGRLGAITR
ncbi:MAG: pirin family protein [Acidimicrobiales bacterium]